MKRVLIIAFHYPPMSGSSGVQRTLKFSRYLSEEGWEPIVLTAHQRAHPNINEDLLKEIPENVLVKRSFAYDTARHLSIRGAYPNILAWPDRWMSWWFSAVPVGLRLIHNYKPEIIMSTYPISTAHLIGLTLHKLTGKAWVADFRDPMVEDNYPTDPKLKKIFRWIENCTVNNASKVIVTTKGTEKLYKARYRSLSNEHLYCIPNGYDEDNFQAAERLVNPLIDEDKPIKLLHSGLLYPSERDPRSFFCALAELKNEGIITKNTLKVIIRASGHDQVHREYIKTMGIEDLVVLKPGKPYVEALSEMLSVDGLLLFQAANCNDQIPAKLYEYFRAGRPILALTDYNGDTAVLLAQLGIKTIASINSKEDIKKVLVDFLNSIKLKKAYVVNKKSIVQFSRRYQAKDLADIFNKITINNR